MIQQVQKSLKDILGSEYLEAVIQGAMYLYDVDGDEARRMSEEAVEFLPDSYIHKMESLLEKVGQPVVPGFAASFPGAATESFRKASNIHASPICGLGFLRLGENGSLYLISKREHYHAPLGHAFPGYELIDNARFLGITNVTHNNTRGYITRLLETVLIRTVNGFKKEDTEGLHSVMDSRQPHVLNRVINLETGSLAVEAGIKMMLARFYRVDKTFPKPKYDGRIPVFFVMGDHEGGCGANYHGTTVIAQTMRGMWPELYNGMEKCGSMLVCPVRINDYDDFQSKFIEYNKAPYKAAGFLHEIILMNYGAVRLKEDYLHKVYALCHSNDTPVLVDEIQSCMWYPEMFLFREYGVDPDFVVIGKGFPGGQYPASRIITTYEMDNLNQFGALVTNGQEELASLAYLITMEFASANAVHIRETGRYYENRLNELAVRYPSFIDYIEGKAHLSAICFHKAEHAVQFTEILNAGCIDISAQTYKVKCPPAALTKLPVISTVNMVDYLIGKMMAALERMNGGDIA